MFSSGSPWQSIRSIGLAALCFAILASCASPPALAQTAAVAQAEPSDVYLIGPSDVLNIYVAGEPEYSITVPVLPDGRISTPQVEEMVAAGKTPRQLARDIESVLSAVLIEPAVTVIVEDFVGTFSTQIRVLGEVRSSGAFAFREGITVLDAVVLAGGLTEFAAGRRATINRMVDGETQEIRIRLDRIMGKGDLSENRPLEPGDIINVPAAIF